MDRQGLDLSSLRFQAPPLDHSTITAFERIEKNFIINPSYRILYKLQLCIIYLFTLIKLSFVLVLKYFVMNRTVYYKLYLV